MTKAPDFCKMAAGLVGGDRAKTHGDKKRNFTIIANLWTAYLKSRRDPSGDLSAPDVGYMMALLKIARTQTGTHNEDDMIDAIGYLACAGEISSESR